MEHLKFMQDSLLRNAEAFKNAEAAIRNDIDIIAQKKVKALAKMLIGNEYPAAALVSHDSWDGERCAGASFKAVCVYKNNYYYSDLKDAVCDGGDELFSITVVFMRDPNPLLANPALYTDKEKEYLQRFVKPYSVEDGKNQDKEQMENELDRCTWDLYRLKHKYYMKFELRWSFGLDDVTSPGFLTNGLRAQCSIC